MTYRLNTDRLVCFSVLLWVLDDLSSGAYVLADDGGDSTPRPHYSGRPIRWGPRTRNGVM